MIRATFCISRARSFEVGGGRFATYYPAGQTDTIMSVQPDGSVETRPADSAGAWETWSPSKDGQRAIFYEAVDVSAFPLVD